MSRGRAQPLFPRPFYVRDIIPPLLLLLLLLLRPPRPPFPSSSSSSSSHLLILALLFLHFPPPTFASHAYTSLFSLAPLLVPPFDSFVPVSTVPCFLWFSRFAIANNVSLISLADSYATVERNRRWPEGASPLLAPLQLQLPLSKFSRCIPTPNDSIGTHPPRLQRFRSRS